MNTLELGPEHFGDAVVCLSCQLKEIIQTVGVVIPDLVWYNADVDPVAGSAWNASGYLAKVSVSLGDCQQFLSGVFIGIKNVEIDFPGFEVFTEDFQPLPISQPYVQVHCFDTTFFWIETNSEAVLAELRAKFCN